MSTRALCETLDRWTPEERFFAAAWLHHRSQAEDQEWLREIEQTQADMDAGRKFSHEQVREMHESLSAAGA
jgi:hypothetical protein